MTREHIVGPPGPVKGRLPGGINASADSRRMN